MDASGAPPMPTKDENAMMSTMMGIVMPKPAMACAPVSGMFPMYARSTILYSTFTSCAVIAGTDSFSSSLPIRSVPSRFVMPSCIPHSPFSPFRQSSIIAHTPHVSTTILQKNGWGGVRRGGNALSFLRKESCAKKGMDGAVQKGSTVL